MTIDFYHMSGSPPCAVVSLTFATLGIESQIKYHHIDITTHEQLKEKYVKINPQHTTPIIIDNGFTLWESRSIVKYLVAKFGNKKLYPEDIKTRALIDQRLDFDLGTLYDRFADYYYTPLLDGSDLNAVKLKKVHEALGFFNSFLEGNKYAVGSELTLADYSLAVNIVIFEISDVSIKEYPNIVRWLKLARSTIPKFEEIMKKYIKDYIDIAEFFRNLVKKDVSTGTK